MARDDMSDTERRFYVAITDAVGDRADAVRQERELTRQIASLCVDAKNAGVGMAMLAKWVKVLRKDNELHSVSRQAIDQLLAQHQGRPRAPRRKASERRNGQGSSKIKIGALT